MKILIKFWNELDRAGGEVKACDNAFVACGRVLMAGDNTAIAAGCVGDTAADCAVCAAGCVGLAATNCAVFAVSCVVAAAA